MPPACIGSSESEIKNFIRFYLDRPLAGCFFLAHVNPETGRYSDCAFDVKDVEGILGYCRRHECNVYISVNTFDVTPGSTKGRTKANVLQLLAVHGDIDPTEGRDKSAILAEVVPQLPPTTFIVDSGHGCQFQIWLEKPVTHPTVGQCDQLRRANEHFVAEHGADNGAKDIARVLRVPGIPNKPDPKKCERKGYSPEPVPCELVSRLDAQCTLDDFVSETHVVAPAALDAEVVSASDVANLEVLYRWPLPDEWRQCVVEGDIYEGDDRVPRFGGDRSRAVFHVVSNLVLWTRDDDLIWKIISHGAFAISERPLERGEEHTKADIARIREKVTPDWVKAMQQRWYAVQIGNQQTFVDREAPSFQPISYKSFKERHDNDATQNRWRRSKNAAFYRGKGSLWVECPLRLVHDDICMHDHVPWGTVWDGDRPLLNVFRGTTIASLDPKETGKPLTYWLRPFWDHLLQVVCSNDFDKFRWLWCWLARCVQQPCAHGESAVIIKGPRGSGKTTVGEFIAAMFGGHARVVHNFSDLIKFNGWLAQAVFVQLEEGVWGGEKKSEGPLKHLITGSRISGDLKGIQGWQFDNHTSIIITSNEDWVVPAGVGERRFAVFDMLGPEGDQKTYFDTLYGHYFNDNRHKQPGDGLRVLLYALLNTNLSEFDPRRPPKTEGLAEQQIASLGPLERMCFDALDVGGFSILDEHGVVHDGFENPVPKNLFEEAYRRECKPHEHRLDKVWISRRLGEWFGSCFERKKTPYSGYGERIPIYKFKNIDECKRRFESVTGIEGLFTQPGADD
jgi:hypothetical protein